MKEIPKIINRGDLTYVLYHEKVVVGIRDKQWVSYNQYDNWNRQGISLFRSTILKSKPSQYDTVTEQITLAMKCGIRGTSTTRPVGVK